MVSTKIRLLREHLPWPASSRHRERQRLSMDLELRVAEQHNEYVKDSVKSQH